MFMNDMDFLRQRLLEPLPGLSVQTEMAPKGRITADYDPNPLGARLSAVLLIVLPDGKLVFIRRAANGRRHSGQIAFPEAYGRKMMKTSYRPHSGKPGKRSGSRFTGEISWVS
jgi:hypothetical protein